MRFAPLVITLTLVLVFAAAARADDWPACASNRKPEAAIKACTRIIDDKSTERADRVTALTNRGASHDDLGRFDLAIADYNKAIDLDPASTDAYVNRGFSYANKGQYDRAIADYEKAMSIKPDDADIYINRGYAYAGKGDHKRAIADFDQALTLKPKEPDQADALVGRGLSYAAMGQAERAASELASVKKLKLDDADASKAENARRQRDLSRLEDLVAAVKAQTAAKPAQAAAPIAPAAPAPQIAAATPAPQPAPVTPAAPPGKRVALVIGNSAYKSVPGLPNAKRDADAVAKGLAAAGFSVETVGANLSREKTIEALRAFAAHADGADWALIYYAGHGIEIGGVNYLIPVDAKLATDRDVQYEAVAMDQVLGAVEGAKKLRIVMLDACRDNPFATTMARTNTQRAIGRGLGRVEPDQGTLVVYAAKHGSTASDGDQATNGPFASAFLKRLGEPGLEIRRLFDLVRDDVMDATGKRQQPFTYGSLPGREDYFFRSRP